MHFPLRHQLCDDETTDAASSRSAAKRLYAAVYWLMLDNITFATDLMAAETRSLLHQEAEKTATKIAVAAVAAAAAADNAASKQKKDEQQFRKRASSFIVK